MSPSHLDTIRRHCRPLQPVPTDTAAQLRSLPGIQAVLFDVYGTLLISASGDVGTAMEQRRAEAFQEALQAVGLQSRMPAGATSAAQCPALADHLIASIQAAHQRAHAAGIEHPEVDITRIWEATLRRLRAAGMLAAGEPNVDLADLAVQYEVRTNPTWPMPGIVACLTHLQRRCLRLGIVSNAQFFTAELFPALLDQTLESLGFALELQFFSYQFGQAKPGRYLYQRAAEALSAVGVPTRNVLYIGNDMLNDVAAAHHVGFRTALFAGDARSLRWRRDDLRVVGIEPDLIVTDLTQLPGCIECLPE